MLTCALVGFVGTIEMQKLEIASFLSMMGLCLSVLGGAISVNSHITKTAAIAESRMTRLEENSRVMTSKIQQFEVDDKRLAEYLFRLERRLADCSREK